MSNPTTELPENIAIVIARTRDWNLRTPKVCRAKLFRGFDEKVEVGVGKKVMERLWYSKEIMEAETDEELIVKARLHNYEVFIPKDIPSIFGSSVVCVLREKELDQLEPFVA